MKNELYTSGIYPVASSENLSRHPRVVTLGGGHGHANLLKALMEFDVDVTAIVTVTDEGGCSGMIRAELGLPPPGDARRCLSAMAQRTERAEYSESRENGRCAGNQTLAKLTALRNFQFACDAMGEWLECKGRVVPAGLAPGTLHAVNSHGEHLEGELAIDASAAPIQLVWQEGTNVNPAALSSIAEADVIMLAPGSIFTSLLAVLTTPGLVPAIAASHARILWMPNAFEPGSDATFRWFDQHLALLRQHWLRLAGRALDDLTILRNANLVEVRRGNTRICAKRMAPLGASEHEYRRIARALREIGILTAPTVAIQSPCATG